MVTKNNEKRMMKAAVVNEFKQQLEIREVPVPELEYGEILVKIKACGVCHTDLHAAHGDWPVKPKLPLIPGHEGVGIVEEVGDISNLVNKSGSSYEDNQCTIRTFKN